METGRYAAGLIGAGRAGSAAGYQSAKRDQSFVILGANEQIGDSWRKRWDSLKLFTTTSRQR